MKKYVLAAVAAVALAGPAAAADLIVAPVIVNDYVAPADDWSGFYAGVFGGYGSGNTRVTPSALIPTTDLSTSGWLLGVTAGVNQQYDTFVLGLEGDVAWANIGGTTALGAVTGTSTTNWVGTLRGRAGVAVDMALLYVTGGLAVGGVSTSTDTPTSFSSTHVGWTAGAGIELAVTEDVSLKAEYAYTDLGTQNDGGVLASGAATSDIHPTFHAVKAGINFHF